MGAAKRRKEKGLMPAQTPKPKKISKKEIMRKAMQAMMPMRTTSLHTSHAGQKFVNRLQMARMNRERVTANERIQES